SGLYRSAFGANRDLVRVQIVQVELVQQRLLADLMSDETWRDVDPRGPAAARPGHVAIDIDSIPVFAVAGTVTDILGVAALASALQEPPVRANVCSSVSVGINFPLRGIIDPRRTQVARPACFAPGHLSGAATSPARRALPSRPWRAARMKRRALRCSPSLPHWRARSRSIAPSSSSAPGRL